jgi:hypothetical protein
MQKDPRSLFIGFGFFVVFADFFASFLFSNAYAQSSTFPNAYYWFNYSNAYNTAVTLTGGQGSGFFAGLINILLIPIRYAISGIIFLGNIFTFIYLAVTWFFNLVNYPFAHIPAPFGTVFQIIFWFITGLSILFGVQVVSTGIRS